MTFSERVAALIEQGNEVLKTDTPNPPGMIGLPTLDNKLFNRWRSRAIALLESSLPKEHHYCDAFRSDVGSLAHCSCVYVGIGILESVKDDFDDGNLDLSGSSLDVVDKLHLICDKFSRVAKVFKRRHVSRASIQVNDEYDVQYIFHGLLEIFFDDVRPEEVVPSNAGKSTRMDFLLKREKTGIEIKHTRKGMNDRDVGSQLSEDIQRYKEHPDCGRLFCFVYDPDGWISNPRGLEEDLSSGGDFEVVVVIR